MEGKLFSYEKFFSFLVATATFCVFVDNSFSQALYSYINENGDRVLTNIAPVRPVSELKVTGTPETNSSTVSSSPKSQSFDPIIEKYASDYQLDPSLIRSIIAQESGFNPKAVSPKGAQGLMQLMPETAARLGVKNSFDPEQNIQGGMKHFKFLMNSFNNNIELSLAAYNAGENLVLRLGKIPEIKETRDYVQSITKRYGKKEVNSQAQETSAYQPIVHFVDASGIWHFTNLPPVQLSPNHRNSRLISSPQTPYFQ